MGEPEDEPTVTTVLDPVQHGGVKLEAQQLFPVKTTLGESTQGAQCKDQYPSCASLKQKYGCDACCLKGKSVAQACPDTCDPCAPKWTAQISQLEQKSKDQQAKIEQLKQQNTNNGDSNALKEQVVTQMESLGGEIKQSVDAGVSEMKALASADELKAVQMQLAAAQKDLIVAQEASSKKILELTQANSKSMQEKAAAQEKNAQLQKDMTAAKEEATRYKAKAAAAMEQNERLKQEISQKDAKSAQERADEEATHIPYSCAALHHLLACSVLTHSDSGVRGRRLLLLRCSTLILTLL